MLFHDTQAGDVSADAEQPPTVRRTFQRLRMVGLSTAEAGNLTAHLRGLRIGRQPWTVAEIERLMFLRALVETGRVDS